MVQELWKKYHTEGEQKKYKATQCQHQPYFYTNPDLPWAPNLGLPPHSLLELRVAHPRHLHAQDPSLPFPGTLLPPAQNLSLQAELNA